MQEFVGSLALARLTEIEDKRQRRRPVCKLRSVACHWPASPMFEDKLQRGRPVFKLWSAACRWPASQRSKISLSAGGRLVRFSVCFGAQCGAWALGANLAILIFGRFSPFWAMLRVLGRFCPVWPLLADFGRFEPFLVDLELVLDDFGRFGSLK